MAVDLICPDCGGVIGGVGRDSEGRGPCTCVNHDDPPRPNGSDTVSIPSIKGGYDAADGREKICIVCGKNVAGHRRVKDSRGYMCLDCAKNEAREEREGTVACAECGRRIKPAGLVEYNGLKICRKCFEDHKETARYKKKVSTKQFDAQEKKGLIVLAVIFVILGLIVAWRTFFK